MWLSASDWLALMRQNIQEIGFSKAAKDLGINIGTLYGWNKRTKDPRLDLSPGAQTPDTAMSLTEEVHKLRQQ